MKTILTLSLLTTALLAPAADPALNKPVDDDMHHFMEYVFEAPYVRLKASLAQAPADKKAWRAVKEDSLLLAEVTTLLAARGPEKDGADWQKHTLATRKDASALYQAARASDFATARKAYTAMLQQCNACHKQFADGEHQLKP